MTDGPIHKRDTLEADAGLLLARVAAGDREALQALYECTVAVVQAACLAGTDGDPLRAELSVEEVYLALWRDAHRFDPGRSTATGYLLEVARATCERRRAR